MLVPVYKGLGRPTSVPMYTGLHIRTSHGSILEVTKLPVPLARAHIDMGFFTHMLMTTGRSRGAYFYMTYGEQVPGWMRSLSGKELVWPNAKD